MINRTNHLWTQARTAMLAVVAVIALAAGTLSGGVAVQASEELRPQQEVVASAPAFTEADWEVAVQELIASDVPRTAAETFRETRYVFHVPVPEWPTGVFDMTITVPKEGMMETTVPRKGLMTPLLGAGSDSGGPYYLLNNFDQNMLIGGGGAVLTAALCAIPGFGWVGCVIISAAVIAGGVWLSMNGVCTNGRQLKTYLFKQGAGKYTCVRV